MFRKLFAAARRGPPYEPIKEVDAPGGRHDAESQTNETDLLESGKSKSISNPRGKEPPPLHHPTLHSSPAARKTLTAVALLMSIFRSKPQLLLHPDEVDAALDDATWAA